MVGPYYNMMVENVKNLLKPEVIGRMFPDIKDLDPVLSGFGKCVLNERAAENSFLLSKQLVD